MPKNHPHHLQSLRYKQFQRRPLPIRQRTIPSHPHLIIQLKDVLEKLESEKGMEETQEEQRKASLTKFNHYMQSMLPAEEREKFQKIGERLYSSFDAHKGTVLPGQDSQSIRLEESLAYVVQQLKSGLHPKYLTYDEIHLLRAGYGDDWYTKFDYTKEDIPTEHQS